MFTKNTEPHQNHFSSRPDDTGPSAPPTPAKPAHTAMALGRSWNGKQLTTIDRVAGITNAAPTPMSERATMSTSGLLARVATNDAEPNTTRPPSRAPLRPHRSPMAPASSSEPANTNA